MKLHLPKLLLTAVLGMACFPSVCAGAEHNLLSSSNHWTLNAYTYQNESIYKAGWGGSAATYEPGHYAYVVGNDSSLTFSLSYIATEIPDKNGIADNDSVFNLVFSGAGDKAIMVGSDYYGTTSINYGLITEKNASQYFGTSADKYNLTSFKGEDGNAVVRKENQTYQITGTVSRADNGNYSLTLNLLAEGNIYTANNIDLGDSFDIRRIVFSSDGGNRTLTGLSITGDLIYDGYLTTVAGNKNAADLSWVSKGAAVEGSDINWTDGSAVIGLRGTGEDASITFAAGTNVSVVEVLEGAVTLKQQDGNLTIGELAAYGSAVLASNMTINSIAVGGEASIAIADNAVVSYTGSNIAFLSNTTGTGTIVLSADQQFGAQNSGKTSSDFAGVIKVTGGTLTLGCTGTHNEEHNFDLSEATVQLAGGNAHYFGNRGELGTLKVSADAELGIFEMKGSDPRFTVETVDIAADKTLTINRGNVGNGDWNLRMEVGRLIGEGNLVLKAGNKANRIFTFDSVGTETTSFGSITNNQTLNLGSGASSILNMGNVDNTDGILNIKGNLAGTSTISGGTINIKEGASVSGNITFGTTVNLEAALTNTGTLTFSTAVDLSNGITNTGTLNFSKGYSSVGTLTNEGIFNLTGNVTIADIGKLEDSGQVTFSHNDGKDGYITAATYFVVESTGEGAYATVAGDSKLMLGSAEIGSITSSGNNLVVDIHNENANSGIYYINTQDLTVDGTETNVAVNATGYVIAKDRTLTLRKNQNTTTMTASKILAEATGEGNITVDCDFTYANGSSSKATGILTIEEGHTLQLGSGTDHVVSIASFNQVVLNGSTLKLHNNGTTIQNLTVKEASTLHLQDTSKTNNNVPNAAHLTGVTNLQAELDVTNGFKGRLVIDSLTGTGNLDIDLSNNAYVSNGDSLIVDINEISNYSGIISYKPAVDTDAADAAAAYANNRITITSTGKGFSIGGLEVTGGVYDNRTASGAATIDIGGDTSLGAVKLGQSSSLTIFNRGGSHTVTMNSLAVDGSAIIQTQRDPNCHNSTINIGELTGTDATLTLKNGSKTTNATVYNLKGGTNQQTGTFSGVINLEGNAEGNSTRPVELLLSNAAVAEKAVINFQNSSADVNHSTYNQMYLKLGVDGAKVAGLRGETKNAAIIASASGTRTLHIVAAENADNTTNATINAGVNLMKSGAGKQTFSGDMRAFNGSLKVIEGELAFTAAEALKVNGLYVGPEKNTAAPAASEGANGGILTVANGIEASGAVTLVGGAVINGNLDLNTATDVRFDVTPTPGTGITLNGALTMSSTKAFVDALDLTSLSAGDILTVFTGLASFTVGGVTYDASNALTNVDLRDWGADVAVGQYTMTYDTSANVGSIVIINRMDAVPEPTTATLSLAALMMLCARRRRRK